MGIETSAAHGGSESSFTSAIIAIEELAKVDPSVSVCCDVHNTLVNTVLRKYATEEQQAKWLPLLAQEHVCPLMLFMQPILSLIDQLARIFLSKRGRCRFRCICTTNPG